MTGKNSNAASLRLDGYIRVSQVGGRAGENFISPDTQRDKINDWARFKGHEVVEWHEELDVSGRKANRPKLDEVMRRIRAGESDGVVVWKCSRFGRNLLNSLMLIKDIDEHGATFASATEEFDTSTRMGKLVMGIMLLLAEDESEGIKESWDNARASAIARGIWMSSATPFGYRQKDDGRLEKDPVAAPIVAELFARRAAGASQSEMVRWLKTTGTTAPTYRRGSFADGKHTRSERDRMFADGKPWYGVAVQNVIKSRVYLGEVSSGPYVKEGAHPPIVDPVTWQNAQRKAGRRWHDPSKPPMLLTGLVRCANCRYTAIPSRPNDYRSTGAYACNNTSGCDDRANMIASRPRAENVEDGYCHCGCGQKTPLTTTDQGSNGSRRPKRPKGTPMLYVPGHQAHANVIGLHEYVLAELWKHMDRIEVQGYGVTEEIEDLKTAVRTARAEEVSWATDREIASTVSREAYLAGGAARHAALESAEAALQRALRTANQPLIDRPVPELRKEFEENMSDDERNRFVSSVIQAVFIRPPARKMAGTGASADRVDVVWFDDAEPDVPRQGRRDYVQQPWVFPDDVRDPRDVGVAAA